MNADTVALIRRTYSELVDDILTAVVGGVVNEPIIFDSSIDLYALREPARDLRGITGTRGQEPFVFQKEVDFFFDDVASAVIWDDAGATPDDETTFYVDYLRRDSRSPLTDVNVGSVTRTLSEAIGREIATVYEQVNQAYLAAFIDTAEGTSLDLVVSILGISRKTKEFARGLVTFFRDPLVMGAVTIVAGTVLRPTKGEATFETSETRTLQRGQVRVDVPVRAGEASKGPAGKVDAGAITELAQPIAGIARVSNTEATLLGAEDETDAELRARAKAALRSLGKATLAALARAIFEQRGDLVEAWDPNGPADKRTTPGSLVLLVQAEPERFSGLRTALEETRAAGVRITVVARYVFATPRLRVQVPGELPADGQAKIVEEVIAALQSYVEGLGAGDPAVGADMLDAIGKVTGVTEAEFADVVTARADVERPGPQALVAALAEAVEAAPPGDGAALRAALLQAVSDPPSAPAGGRVPDRSLVRGPTGQPATDEEIEAGQFEVVAVVGGEPWWVFLDMGPEDVVLVQEA